MLPILVNNQVVSLKTQLPWRQLNVHVGRDAYSLFLAERSRLLASKEAILAAYAKEGYDTADCEASFDYLVSQPTLQLLNRGGRWTVGQANPLEAFDTEFAKRAEAISGWVDQTLRDAYALRLEVASGNPANITAQQKALIDASNPSNASYDALLARTVESGGYNPRYVPTMWMHLIDVLQKSGYKTRWVGETVTDGSNIRVNASQNPLRWKFSPCILLNSCGYHMIHGATVTPAVAGFVSLPWILKYPDSVPWTMQVSIGDVQTNGTLAAEVLPFNHSAASGSEVMTQKVKLKVRITYPYSAKGDHEPQVYTFRNCEVEEIFVDADHQITEYNTPFVGRISYAVRMDTYADSQYGGMHYALDEPSSKLMCNWIAVPAELKIPLTVPEALTGVIAAFGKPEYTLSDEDEARGNLTPMLGDWVAVLRMPVADRWAIDVETCTYVAETHSVETICNSNTFVIDTEGQGFKNLAEFMKVKFVAPQGRVVFTRTAGCYKTASASVDQVGYMRYAGSIADMLAMPNPYNSMKINNILVPELLNALTADGVKHFIADALTFGEILRPPANLAKYLAEPGWKLTVGWSNTDGEWDVDGALYRSAMVKDEADEVLTKEDALLLVSSFGFKWFIKTDHVVDNNLYANYLKEGMSAGQLLGDISSPYSPAKRSEFRIERLLPRRVLAIDPFFAATDDEKVRLMIMAKSTEDVAMRLWDVLASGMANFTRSETPDGVITVEGGGDDAGNSLTAQNNAKVEFTDSAFNDSWRAYYTPNPTIIT